jgi:peptidoglycan/LPS O-acetylase OafA/YrhL
METGKREIYPLTSLRFFAASLVVLAHLQMLPGLEWLGFKNDVPGVIGVRIFFVLSGFVISYTYWNRNWSGQLRSNAGKFYWSRFARIYPLHWLMFLLALPLGLNSNTARVSVWNFPWLLSLTDKLWPGFDAGPQPVKPAWTLSCEILFYLSTPLLFWFLTRRKNSLRASTVTLIAFVFIILVLTAIFPKLNWTAYIEIPQFLVGVVGFHLARRVDLSRWANAVIISGMLLLAGASIFNDHMPQLQGISRATWVMIVYCAYAPGALLIVLGFAVASGRVGKFLSLPFLVLLGQASYALYLIHSPALRYLRVVLIRNGVIFSIPAGVLVAILFFCMAITASILCFKIYENPIRLKLRSLLKRKPHSAVAIET